MKYLEFSTQIIFHWGKRSELHVVNIIKREKIWKNIGKNFSDGSKEIGFIPREEISSQTILLETLLTTLSIDDMEQRIFVTLYVSVSYLNSSLPDTKFKLIKFKYEFVDLMCESNRIFKDLVRFLVKKRFYT